MKKFKSLKGVDKRRAKVKEQLQGERAPRRSKSAKEEEEHQGGRAPRRRKSAKEKVEH